MQIQELNIDFTTINTQVDPEVMSAMERPREIMAELFDKHPDWAELMDEVNPLSAPRGDVLELLRSAPTDAAIMMIYAYYCARQEIAMMTGRPFV